MAFLVAVDNAIRDLREALVAFSAIAGLVFYVPTSATDPALWCTTVDRSFGRASPTTIAALHLDNFDRLNVPLMAFKAFTEASTAKQTVLDGWTVNYGILAARIDAGIPDWEQHKDLSWLTRSYTLAPRESVLRRVLAEHVGCLQARCFRRRKVCTCRPRNPAALGDSPECIHPLGRHPAGRGAIEAGAYRQVRVGSSSAAGGHRGFKKQANL